MDKVEDGYTLDEDKRWLDGAQNLDVCHHSRLPEFHALADKVFADINREVTVRNKNRTKQTLKTILLNLWVAGLCDNPVMYSRNASKYNHSQRYGKLHFKYERVKKIMDTLYCLNYIEQNIGYFNRVDGFKRRTRIYALNPLQDLFNEFLPLGFDVVERETSQEIIQLRSDDKSEIDYTETLDTTKKRVRLYNYNKFIQGQALIIDVPCSLPIKVSFLKDLRFHLLAGLVGLNYFESNNLSMLPSIEKPSLSVDNLILKYINNNLYVDTLCYDSINNKSNINYINNNNYNIYSIVNTITNVLIVKKYSFVDKTDNKEKIILRDLGITKLGLSIKYSSLHRVFNNGSFELGGRFYGAFHLRMPKELRPFIRMNDGKTIELDYSAQHIRMLYHWEGNDYRDDPYEALCDSPEERNFYKLLQLIVVNADNEKIAIQALRQVIRDKGFKCKIRDKDLYPLVEKFKQAHKPIANYLTSGVGRRLQNIDSRITEFILMELKNLGIPALPVHDSFIVEDKYEGALAEKMNEGYERVMGFSPVIG